MIPYYAINQKKIFLGLLFLIYKNKYDKILEKSTQNI